jgi:MFS family permease
MNASIENYVDEELVPIAMGFLAFLFGVGQFLAPSLSGLILDSTRSYYYVLLASAAVTFSGGLGFLGIYIKSIRTEREREARN